MKLAQVSTFGKVLSMLEGFLVWWPFWPFIEIKVATLAIYRDKSGHFLTKKWPFIEIKVAILATLEDLKSILWVNINQGHQILEV